jgi:phosphoribosylformylglycinamidine synthase subunit PurQ / glutaminase
VTGPGHDRGGIAVLLFPGTNCELDVVEAVRNLGAEACVVWHGDERLPQDTTAVVLPGGFAHGDYLRTGAIARFSPIMAAVESFAAAGGPVLGICNGFQILCEAGLLPGALQKNAGLKFLCQTVSVVVENATTVATRACEPRESLRLPINHFEGSFTCAPETLERMRERDQVVFRYEEDVNGSVDRIAGVSNEAGNVVGLMPHPERASDALLGSDDGRRILESLLLSAAG